MPTIYVDRACTDDDRRRSLYSGDLQVLSPSQGAAALCSLARELSEEAFAPHDPKNAQEHTSVEDYVGIRGLEVTEGQVIRLVAEATEQTLAVAPKEVERGSALGATSGIDNLLEIEVRAGGIFRIGGPGAGGRVTAGAVYADLARLASGERPILFGGNA